MPEQTIAEILAAALKQEEFVLYGQEIRPITASRQEKPFQEILVRFQQEEEQLLPPGTFFPILKEEGLIPQLDRWVVGSVIKWIHSGLAIKPDWLVPRNNINIAPDTLGDPAFTAFIKKHVEIARTPPDTLGFEIPWSTIVERGQQMQQFIGQLKPIGCRFTLAGFEGYEQQVSVLKYLKPDYVKIGTRLLRNLGSESPESKVVAIISRQCQSMHIATIAEQIESEQTLAEVKRVGIDFAQGFAISLPHPLR
jgi:EAL domain-containing protein (putative c-di-GMP-specific phosphodiesterase class I)